MASSAVAASTSPIALAGVPLNNIIRQHSCSCGSVCLATTRNV
jgi:hypothetical protein